MNKLLLRFSLLAFTLSSYAQEVSQTFTSTRIINGHSVETLKKNHLEYRIEHRFGDMFQADWKITDGLGFDQASDIRFALEYGVSDKFMFGFGRSKGTSAPFKSLLDGFLKYRLLTQSDKMPISVSLTGVSTYTYAKSNPDIYALNHYGRAQHRYAYSTQLNLARKFSERISIAVMPTLIYRNLVETDDVNALFALGFAGTFKLSKSFGLTVEYYQNINQTEFRKENYTNSLALGLEWNTNGHTFHFNFTNSEGFNDTQFIPYTKSDWSKGQFRIGFSIARAFKI